MAKREFMEAYDQYADEIYRFCFFKVSNTERAQDFTQDVFTRFWQTLRDGKPVTHPRALLYTIARNRITDWYRKKKEESLDELSEKGHEITGQGASDVEQAAEYDEVLRAIDDLDEPSKEALLLRFTEGWSPAEIADLHHESANAVSVRLNRAVKKVQDRLHL